MIPRWPAPPGRRTARGRRVAAVTVAALAVALVQPLAARADTPPAPPSDAKLAKSPARHDLTREQFYFVLPDRFANGDTGNDRGGLTGSRLTHGYDPTDKGFYQGGDLKGLTKNLDYIKGLGTTAIWMAPIFKNQPVQGTGDNASAGYHGYWITDFTQVDPHFGTNQDLENLIDKAHAKGMKVFFDVITNHTADVVDYQEKSYEYLSKGAFPYLTKDGEPFDDADYADGSSGFPRVDSGSFPRTPVVPGAKKRVKVPSWLNDPAMYHNRGDSTFAGESSEYGDFSGLDDLWTERPEVVDGMEKIYQRWVRDFDIDGFRIDTVKHVNMEFWTQWATALDAYAAKKGRDDFFMFGEVYSSDTNITAPYVTRGRLDATLDFPFQEAARQYASQGGSARKLASVFGDDHKYTTDKANAYEQVTFLGNHDMGRIGTFLTQDNPKASDAELLKKDMLANELMFLSRGNPVVYYGDEQGFTGAGGDKDARQTLFASRTADYLDDDLIGTDRTHAEDVYDTKAPLYRQISALAKLRKAHPALTDGIQQERYASDGAGVYAFSRTGTGKDTTEYVVAFNNAGEAAKATFATGSARMTYKGLYGTDATVTSDAGKKITVTVPAGSAIVLKASGPLAAPAAKPAVTLKAPEAGATGTVELTAGVEGGQLNRVVFAAQTGNGKWQTLGSADHAPYKVTHTIGEDVPAGTALRYKAVVIDSSGRTASALAASTTGTPPVTEPPSAASRDYAVVHYKRADGDYDDWGLYAWGDIAEGEATEWPAGHPFTGRDAYGAFAHVKLKPGASDVGFVVVDKEGNKDVAADRTIDVTRTGEIWIEQGKEPVATERPEYPAQDTTKAVLHYQRADGNYDGWGLHTWTGAANPTDWSNPLKPVRTDAYGAVFEVPLAEGATSLSYILHKGDEKDLPTDQSLDLRADGHEVWLLNGQEKYLLPQPAGSAAALDLTTSKAVWIDRNTLVWDGSEAAASTQLLASRTGSVTVRDGALDSGDARWLRLARTTLTDAQKAKFPHLAKGTAWTVDPRDRDRVREALRGQVVAAQHAANGAVLAATGVQIAGVLDDLYAAGATKADLGPVFRRGRPTLSLWAPTARNVSLEIAGRTVRMERDDATGVWSVTGPASWKGKEYRYTVQVWAPSTREIVTNKVTDPYSVALTTDSERSLVVDLADRSLAPEGWSSLGKPKAVPLKDAQIQELHIRDFSVADRTAKDPGTYRAFTDKDSDGSKHLRELAKAGTSYVHLLPAFDIATIPEKKADRESADCDLGSYPADSAEQQKCVTEGRRQGRLQLGLRPVPLHGPRGLLRHRPGRHRPHGRVPRDGQGAQRGRPPRRHGRRLQPHRRERSGQDQRPGPDRPRLLPAAAGRRLGRQQHLLRQHGHRERHDGQARRRLGRHLGQGVQGRRLPLRPHGPPPEGQHPRRPQGPRRADPREGRGRRQEDHPLRGGLELRRDRRRRPLRAGHAEEHGRHRHRHLLRPGPRRRARRRPLRRGPGRAGLRLRPLHRPQLLPEQRHGGRAEGPPAALPGPDQGRPQRQPRRLHVHRHQRQGGQGLPGRLQRRPRRIRGRTRRRPRLRGRPRQRVPVRRARLQAAGGHVRRRPGPYAGPRHGDGRPLAGPGALPGGHRPAALQVAGPQLLRQRRLVQRHPLELRGRQRLRPRSAAGRRQRGQVALRQAPAGHGEGGLPADRGRLGRVPGPAAHPYDGEGLLPRHGRAGAVPALLPAVRQGRDTRCDHHEARRPGRRLQRHAGAAGAARRRAGRHRSPAAPGAVGGRGRGREDLVVREGHRHVHRSGAHGRRVHHGRLTR
ncbi:glycosidase [Streptomyces sp. SLBN-134]|nr:glycosidase [Streptomyces sp. SLBN-134]